MPLYEYRCESCGERIEVLQRFSDPPPTVCPSCGGALKKMMSAPAFQFKGSGFYQTDYVKKSGGGSETATPAKAESKGEAAAAGHSGEKSGEKAGDKGGGKSGDKGGDSSPAKSEAAPSSAAASKASPTKASE